VRLCRDEWPLAANPHPVEQACLLTGRNMSLAEWRVVSTRDYVRHCTEFPPGLDAPDDAQAWNFLC
jgi:hypothetical protein